MNETPSALAGYAMGTLQLAGAPLTVIDRLSTQSVQLTVLNGVEIRKQTAPMVRISASPDGSPSIQGEQGGAMPEPPAPEAPPLPGAPGAPPEPAMPERPPAAKEPPSGAPARPRSSAGEDPAEGAPASLAATAPDAPASPSDGRATSAAENGPPQAGSRKARARRIFRNPHRAPLRATQQRVFSRVTVSKSLTGVAPVGARSAGRAPSPPGSARAPRASRFEAHTIISSDCFTRYAPSAP